MVARDCVRAARGFETSPCAVVEGDGSFVVRWADEGVRGHANVFRERNGSGLDVCYPLIAFACSELPVEIAAMCYLVRETDPVVPKGDVCAAVRARARNSLENRVRNPCVLLL